jgi:ABC-type lipoprotein release transport system permease subunit
MQSILIKGINPKQKLFLLPSHALDTVTDAIPAFIGSIMAKNCKLAKGDYVTIRWRDANGTFDATEILITDIFETSVSTADMSQVYIALEKLQSMMLLPGEATILTFRDSEVVRPALKNWTLKPKNELTKSVDEIIKAKSSAQTVLFAVLLLLAMLAIFDSQILSIFRRQKEIGTYIALGYTRPQVVGLFTVEGTMYAVLAALLSAAYGLPFLTWQAKAGWTMPIDSSEFGMTIAKTLYPIYSAGLVVSTVLIITLVTAIVSYWPSRKIAKMNPTEALRGKLQ